VERYKLLYTMFLSLGAIAALVLLSALGRIGDPSALIVAIGMGGFNTAVDGAKRALQLKGGTSGNDG
jgi:hypothetical protein